MNQNYHSEFLVKVSPGTAIKCISDVQGWWSTNFEGQSKQLNDIFHVRFGKTWADIRIIQLSPGTLTWEVTACFLNLLKNTQEWVNTQIDWKVEAAGEMTKISMSHVGLVPALECFKDCSNGWNFFTQKSLYQLIADGKGSPAVGIHGYVQDHDKTYKGTLYYKNDPLPDLTDGDVIIDVKTNAFERVTAAHNIQVIDGHPLNLQKLHGDNYLVLEASAGLTKILTKILC
jgi:hypothetical protein